MTTEANHRDASTSTTVRPDRPHAPKAAPGVRWVPVPEEAFQAALLVRTQVQRKIRMRPDVSIVIAALLTHACKADDIADVVARYGLSLYAGEHTLPIGDAANGLPSPRPVTDPSPADEEESS